jgi:hypothetical protein
MILLAHVEEVGHDKPDGRLAVIVRRHGDQPAENLERPPSQYSAMS